MEGNYGTHHTILSVLRSKQGAHGHSPRVRIVNRTVPGTLRKFDEELFRPGSLNELNRNQNQHIIRHEADRNDVLYYYILDLRRLRNGYFI